MSRSGRERIQFTCGNCEKEVDREPGSMDIPGATPVLCVECVLAKMSRGGG